MTDTPAHTPLPLSCTHNSWERSTIYDAEGYEVCTIAISWEADEDTQEHFEALKDAKAAFIVRACNSHYQLVSALESANTLLTKAVGDIVAYRIMAGKRSSKSATAEYVEAINAIDAALSQAGGASD